MTFTQKVLPGHWTTHVSRQCPSRRVVQGLNSAVDDDYAAYKLAVALGKSANITSFLLERALRTPFTLFNNETGFMEARNEDGSWAGADQGWTEGKSNLPAFIRDT